MNYGVYVQPAERHCPVTHVPASAVRGVPSAVTQPVHSVSMKVLETCPRQRLPLNVEVISTTVEDDHVVYHCTMTSKVTKNTWTVSYRYSEFYAFKAEVAETWTCRSPKCSGSCQAIRDYINACFPHKRLLSSVSQRTIDERKAKLENVLLHMLRTVLFPGSAMKCAVARQRLPKNVLNFLGVQHSADRRSLLQIFVDNFQEFAKHHSRSSSASTASTASNDSASTWTSALEDAEQCIFCMEDFDHEEHGHDCCLTDDESSVASSTASSFAGSEPVMLPCKHTFHRECLFEWLMFQFHCPLCRSRVGPPAVTSICRAKSNTQWWIGDFEEDPTKAPKALL